MFRDIVSSVALHRAGDDHLGLPVGRFLGFDLNDTDHLRSLMPGLAFDLLHEPGACLLGRQAGNLLKSGLLLDDQFLKPLLLLLDRPLLLGNLLLQTDQFAFLEGQGLHFLFQPLFLGLQPGLVLLDLPLPILGVLLYFLLQGENLVLRLEQNFLLMRLGVLFGFVENTLRQFLGVFNFLVGDVFFEEKARNCTDADTNKCGDNDVSHEKLLGEIY